MALTWATSPGTERCSVDLAVVDPRCHAYGFYAYLFAMLGTRPERSAGWLLSNFVQLCWDPREDSPVPFCFYLNDVFQVPGLSTATLDRNLLTAETVTDALRGFLEQGRYVFLHLDQHHLPRGEEAHGAHFTHDVLVHGYDARGGVFHLLGHSSTGQFRRWSATEENVRRAYHGVDKPGPWDRRIVLFTPDEDEVYAYDGAVVARTIGEYLASVDTSDHYRLDHQPWPRIYGLATYEPLAEHVERALRDAGEHDRRHLQVLYEHKVMELDRLRYIGAPAVLVEQSEANVAHARFLRDSLVKAELRGDGRRYLDDCRIRLAALRAAEVDLLECHLRLERARA